MIDCMKRRSFIKGLAVLGITSGLSTNSGAVFAVGSAKQENLKITKVEILQITGKNKRKALYLKIS